MDYYTPMTQKQEIFNLMGGHIRIYRGLYNPTSDAVWLAAYAPGAKTVLDVGIGTGGVSLCYLANNPNSHVTGLDISTDMLTECAANADLNDRNIELINADILKLRTGRTFDLVMTNPPYFKGTPKKLQGIRDQESVHHNIDLISWTKRCIARVKPRGHFCTIVDAAVMDQVIGALVPTCGDIQVFPLFGAKDTAERALIRARLGVRGPAKLFSGAKMNFDPILRDGLTVNTAFTTILST